MEIATRYCSVQEIMSAYPALFIWEGSSAYVRAEAVEETLAFVVNNSGVGSSIIFDYVYRSVVDGTCDLAVCPEISG